MEAELSIPLAINNQLLLFPPVAGPSCQLRQRELGSLSEATSDTMSCAAQRHGRGSAPFFPHLSGRLSGHSATRRRRPDRTSLAAVLTAPAWAEAETLVVWSDLSSSSLSPKVMFFVVFAFYGSAVKKRRKQGEKKTRMESPEVGSTKSM